MHMFLEKYKIWELTNKKIRLNMSINILNKL